jgi:hypothetical protein
VERRRQRQMCIRDSLFVLPGFLRKLFEKSIS